MQIVYLLDIFDTGPDPLKTENFVTQLDSTRPVHGRTRPTSNTAWAH